MISDTLHFFTDHHFNDIFKSVNPTKVNTRLDTLQTEKRLRILTQGKLILLYWQVKTAVQAMLSS